MVILWSQHAKIQLQEAYNYISRDSPKAAEKVINDIIDITLSLSLNPETHPPDKYKIDNDGAYRAFEIYHYRIAYRISNNSIRILRLRHTKMSPLKY